VTAKPIAASAEHSPARRFLWPVLRFAVGVGLIVYLVRSDVIQLRLLSKLYTAWLLSLAGLALTFIDIALMAVRLSWLLSPRGLHLSFADSLELNLVSSFFNTFLPGTTGGDVVKLFYAIKEKEGRRTEIATVVIFDRLLGLFSVLLLPLLFAPLFYEFIRGVPGLGYFLLTAAVCALGMLLALLLCLFAPAAVNRVFAWASRFLPSENVVERAVNTIAEYRRNPGTLCAALGLSLAANLTLIAITALAILVLYPADMTMKVFIIVPLGDLANSVPLTPGGLGVGEAAYNALFRLAGLEGGANVLLCWRIWRLVVALIGLVLYLRGVGGRVRKAPGVESSGPREQF
jgi:glycosyltransferase 2 family protein